MCQLKARNALGHVFVSQVNRVLCHPTSKHTRIDALTETPCPVCVQMRELVSALSSDPSVRVVVFRSLVPGVFCAGTCSLEGFKYSRPLGW